MIIETHELTKMYRGRGGCRDVTLTVQEGAIFGLLGPNGAGKSTFVKMLAGLHRPDSGMARVLGHPIGHAEARQKLGYLPELFRFHDWLSAAEVLDFHASLSGVTRRERQSTAWKRRIEALLGEVGLDGHARQRVGGFSKGMQQRLGLAAALLMEPQLVILDEPASALDPVGRYEVRQLLVKLREKGVTVFLNTHLLEDVEELCDEVAFLYSGELLAAGPLAELIHTGANWRFRVGGWFSGGLTGVDGAEAGMPELTVEEADEEGNAVLTAMIRDREQAGWLHTLFYESGLTLYESGPIKTGLEEWFIRTVAERREQRNKQTIREVAAR